jgi:hypothetical protein
MKFLASTKRRSLQSIVAAGLLVAFGANTSFATVLWYDGFTTKPGGDYDTAAVLNGQSGGTGTFFSGPWDVIGTDDSGVLPTSLSIPGQINPSTGGALGEAGGYGTSRTARVFTDQWGAFTDPEGVYYMSYLVNYGGLVSPNPDPAVSQSQHRVIEMFNGDAENDSTRNFMLGYSHYALGGAAGSTDDDNMAMYLKGASPEKVLIDADPSLAGIQPKNFATDQNKTHLVVLKFDMHINDGDDGNGIESDIISMYLDPVGTTEPALPNAQQSVANFFIDRLDPNAYFVFEYDPVFSTALPVVDEFRVTSNADGQGFANAANWTGVPEPTSLGLVLFGSLGMLAAGRRRS